MLWDRRTTYLFIRIKYEDENPFMTLLTKALHFSLLMCSKIITYGLVKTFVKPLFIFWIIFLLALELKFIDKL